MAGLHSWLAPSPMVTSSGMGVGLWLCSMAPSELEVVGPEA